MATGLVVLLHASLLPQHMVDLPQPICRMAVLMVISGAVAAPALDRGWSYSRDRALDLLWLTLVWTPVMLLALGGVLELSSLLRELVAPTTHLWYVGGLALLALSVPVLRHLPPLLVLSVSGAAALWHLSGGRTGISGYDQMLHFTLFFHAGLYGRRHLLALLARCGVRAGWTAAAALALLLTLPLPHSMVTMGSAAALLFVAQGLAESRAGAALTWLGRRTPDVYLPHAPLLILIGRMVGPFGLPGLLLLTVAALALCLGLRVMADRIGLGWMFRRPQFATIDPIRWTAPFLREVGRSPVR